MADGDQMKKVDLSKDKVSAIQREYMKRVQKQNDERVAQWRGIRMRNRFIGVGLGCMVASIYAYSMIAIKQESFLDDFNEPEKVVVEK
ncbi:unnamed protein product [Trichogramma brassicae]|uniref:Cytochrome c oxidase assembly factor 3 n=2 Tax=Trichogramma TaxID=7490 RepID=A0A6H5IDT7_9HYME|nr:unnamed protein product [Trichogramma brassicae]